MIYREDNTEGYSASVQNALAALAADGYDVHEYTSGLYIANLAPDSADYDGVTDPGSPWDDECDWRLEAINAIVAPHGCRAEWSDDDVAIEEGGAL